jgi:hypothetical protein
VDDVEHVGNVGLFEPEGDVVVAALVPNQMEDHRAVVPGVNVMILKKKSRRKNLRKNLRFRLKTAISASAIFSPKNEPNR